MLRAGKNIEFRKDRLDSHNGILLSPIINLCGLILRADRPIPEPIKIFLESKGVDIKLIYYKEGPYISLRGHYEITKSDIESFIYSHAELVQDQKNGLDEISPSLNFQREIASRIDRVTQPLLFQENEQQYFFQAVTVVKSNRVEMEAGECYENHASRISSCSDMHISAPKIINRGQQLLEMNRIGFFAESISNTNMIMKSQLGFHENAITDASQTLILEPLSPKHPSEEILILNSEIRWFNNPHPELTQESSETDTINESLMMGVD